MREFLLLSVCLSVCVCVDSLPLMLLPLLHNLHISQMENEYLRISTSDSGISMLMKVVLTLVHRLVTIPMELVAWVVELYCENGLKEVTLPIFRCLANPSYKYQCSARKKLKNM